MKGILYCRASDIVTATATIALTSGAAAAAFPLANGYDKRPAKAFKATGTSCTIRFTYAGAQALQGFSIHNHNLVGATVSLTNNGGMTSQPFTIPADAEDGLSVDPCLDLRNVANASATQWNLVITGASANVAIGEFCPIATLRSLLVLPKPIESDEMPAIQHPNARGGTFDYPLGTRLFRFRGQLLYGPDRVSLLSWRRDALGVGRGFVFIPDEDVMTESYFMKFEDPQTQWARNNPEAAEASFGLIEVGRGLGV